MINTKNYRKLQQELESAKLNLKHRIEDDFAKLSEEIKEQQTNVSDLIELKNKVIGNHRFLETKEIIYEINGTTYYGRLILTENYICAYFQKGMSQDSVSVKFDNQLNITTEHTYEYNDIIFKNYGMKLLLSSIFELYDKTYNAFSSMEEELQNEINKTNNTYKENL